MFGLGTRQGKSGVDPLASRRVAAEWLRALPAQDVLGRQQHLAEAFDAARHAAPPLDLDRVAALVFLDGAVAADRARVQQWYTENRTGSAQLAERLWQTSIDVNHGFLFAYRAAADRALARGDDRRWQPLLPLLLARLAHAHGVDAKLRMFRREPCIPMKWAQLHAVFLQATARGIERVPVSLDPGNPLVPRSTVEHEYLHALLLHRLDTGNLTPAEFEWAAAQLHDWGAALALDAAPANADGFFVDLAGAAGLVRRTGNDQGEQVGYLDTFALIVRLDQALARLRAPPADVTPHPLRHDHIAVLERIRPALAPRRSAELRRHPRAATDVPAAIRVGLTRITHDLADDAPALPQAPAAGDRCAGTPHSAVALATAVVTARIPKSAGGGAHAAAAAIANTRGVAEEIDIRPLPADALPRAAIAAPAAAPPVAVDNTQWRLKDRSATGCRISAPFAAEHSLTLGALVALWAADVNAWTLGVVRRLTRGANEELDAGMSVIADHVVAVSLHSRRRAQDDLSFTVDGLDVSTLGARFSGLYFRPPAVGSGAPTMRTLIIPTAEHVEGRNLILTTARSIYAVTLRRLIDQRADWSWVTIEVAARAPVARA